MTLKISAMTAATTPLAGTEELEVNQGGSTVKATVDELNVLALLADGTRASSGAQTFSSGVVIGGNTVSDVLVAADGASTSDLAMVTAGYMDANPPATAAHLLGSASHTADTLANLNAKISDATLVDTGDSRFSDARTPTAHLVGAAEHSADTLANFNTKISDATLIDGATALLTDGSQASTGAQTFSSGIVIGGNTASDVLLAADGISTSDLALTTAGYTDALFAQLAVTQVFTGAQYTNITTLTDAATIAVDASLNNAFQVTITAARILGNPTNVVQGMSWTVEVIQDVTGGWALTFGTNYVGPAITGPLDTSADAANKIRVLTCYANSPTKISVMDMGEAV